MQAMLKAPLIWLQIRFGLHGCICPVATSEHFEAAVHEALTIHQPSVLGISESLRQILLLPGDEGENHLNLEEEDETQQHFLCYGLPTRPFYRELARRLHRLMEIQILNSQNNLLLISEKGKYFALPAEKLGLEELVSPTINSLPPVPTKPTIHNIYNFLRSAGDEGVLSILGMRRTVGTDPHCLLPPPRSILLEAASAPHKKGHGKLSVAAKARAKHAHRGQEQFFGVAKGSPEKQSADALAIVMSILDNCCWSNIHVFGGVTEPVLEVRVKSGYGCRWRLASNSVDPTTVPSVEFRGFLEPQMEDGHEKGWKH